MEKKQFIVLSVLFACLTVHLSYGQGARYTGSYAKSPTIQHVGKKNFVIEGLEFSSNDKDMVVLYSCENVVIKNNSFKSSLTKRAIYLDNCKNITLLIILLTKCIPHWLLTIPGVLNSTTTM